MSFILQNYSRASISYNKDSFATYNYIHPTDTIIVINANDYFITQQSTLSINDVIKVQTVEGLFSLKVTAVTPIVITEIASQALNENSNVVLNTLQLKNLNGAGHLVSSATAIGQEPELGDNADLVAFNGGIAIGPSPVGSAIFQSASTILGWLPPRMTTAERDGIPTPDEGLFVFNTTTDTLDIRAGGVWKTITAV